MTLYAFPQDWTMSRVLYTGAAVVAAGAMIAGAAAFIADGARNTSSAPGRLAPVLRDFYRGSPGLRVGARRAVPHR